MSRKKASVISGKGTGCCDEKTLLLLPEIEPKFFGTPACSPVTIHPEISLLLSLGAIP
jgi:hypothetical protein